MISLFLPKAHAAGATVWASGADPGALGRSTPTPLVIQPPGAPASVRAASPTGQGIIFHLKQLSQEDSTAITGRKSSVWAGLGNQTRLYGQEGEAGI